MDRVFSFAGGSLPLGRRTYLWGILNVTPDSFYDGGRYCDPAAAVKKGVCLAEEGADVLDVGALSTRPGAPRADEAEELRRLSAVLPRLRREVSVPISVDTYRPAVARYALEQGADIINDVSGTADPAGDHRAKSADHYAYEVKLSDIIIKSLNLFHLSVPASNDLSF